MGGARLDLMRLCPEPATYELGFTHTERPVVVAIAEIRNDHVLRGYAAGGVGGARRADDRRSPFVCLSEASQ